MQVNFTLSDGTQTQVDVQVQDPQTINSASFTGNDGTSHTLQESTGGSAGMPSKVTITNADNSTTDFVPAGSAGTSAQSGNLEVGKTVTLTGVPAGQGQPNPGQQSQ